MIGLLTKIWTISSFFSFAAAGKDVIVILGGQTGVNEDPIKSAELFSPEGDDTSSCLSLPDFVYEDGSAGFYVDGKVVVCGGHKNKDGCYEHNKVDNTWDLLATMPEQLCNQEVNEYFSGSLWITGGEHVWPGKNYVADKSTFLLDVNSGYITNGPDLPEHLSMHSVVKIDEHRSMIVGNVIQSDRVWIHDSSKTVVSEQWEMVSNLLEGVKNAAAGLVVYPDNTKAVVVVGGNDSKKSQIFRLDTKVWTWGPDLPQTMWNASAAVQIDNTFYLVTGQSGYNQYVTDVARFNPASGSWKVESGAIQNGRKYSTAFRVPASYLNC